MEQRFDMPLNPTRTRQLLDCLDLRTLFLEELGWSAAAGLRPRPLKLAQPIGLELTAAPIAHLGGLTVFRLDWPGDRLPGVTARRAVQRALAPTHAEHLVVYIADNGRQLAFTWARRRGENRIELRTLPYEKGSPARTTLERLALLQFPLEELDRYPDAAPPITAVTAKLDAAFDVEAVTRQFYQEIANWYFWARNCQDVVLPKDVRTDEDRALFLIRLLTRLIFCWFLRKKRNPRTNEGLLPDVLFDESRIPRLLKDASPDASTYYPAILQNLFFATLNTEMDKPGQPPNRRFVDEGDGHRSDDHMIHTRWRNARLLRDPEALAALLRDVPFLNGGLFECLDDRGQKGKSAFTEEIRIDGFSNDPRKQPKLPNFLFFGADQVVDLSGVYHDTGRRRETVSPLLSILNRYNFTITEATPLDQEVALDPELLGHVFENLLAAYNPETGTVARKATGSFYTPRVVVDWMVDQALLAHLGKALARANKVAATDSPEDRLRQLLSWQDTQPEFSRAETEALIDAIDHLKALDPACGSGAFPMGLLQKLVHVLRKLDPENKGWRTRQEKALDTFDSSIAREEARLAIQRAFARDNDDYGRKLYLIENCLYGVDIQPIAVQIAKLRFFIALVCDQSIDPAEPNYGILPLPNLETRIVTANTLLGLQRGQLLLGSDRVRQLEKQLQQVRHDYFTARRYKDKKALRARDKQLCAELATALTDSGECSPYDARRLAEWNPYDTNQAAPFFDPAWMFGLTGDHGRAGPRSSPGGTATSPSSSSDGGPFDIVIGNPPYVRHEELKNVIVTGSDGNPRPLKDALKNQYDCYTGTADLYVYFFERSFQLLKLGGVLSFVTSNKYMRAAYGERLRAYLLWATRPRVILDFGDSPVFTSIAYPCILVAEKTRSVQTGGLPNPQQFAIPERINQLLDAPDRGVRVHTWNPGNPLLDFPDIFDAQATALAQRDLKPDGWRLESPVSLRLLERLCQAGKPLREYVGSRVYRGITTGFNKAFVVDRATRDRLIEEHNSSADVLKPLSRGRDVERWRCEFAEQYLILIESSENVNHPWSGNSDKEAERIFARTHPAIHEHFERWRKELINRYDQGHFFWELRSCDYWQEFDKPKVVSTKVSIRPTFAMDRQGCYLGNTSYFIPAGDTGLYVLALLNSNLYEGYARRVFATKQGGWYEVQPDGLEAFPIPAASESQRRCCERLAEALIWLHGPAASRKPGYAPLDLLKSYFEQWLNGLVYELFFPEELHARKLALFATTAKLNPPDLAAVPEGQKLARLQELHAAADKSALPAMLAGLTKLEEVRLIEEAGRKPAPAGREANP